MDVIVVFNGLGNQMSQYAFYLAKKERNKNCHLIFDPKSANRHNGSELDKLFEDSGKLYNLDTISISNLL